MGTITLDFVSPAPGGRVLRWCWVNFQCQSVLLVLNVVGQGPTALTVGASGGCLVIFTLVYHFSLLSPALWKMRYRLKYCLKGPLSPKHPTNQMPHLRHCCKVSSGDPTTCKVIESEKIGAVVGGVRTY